MGSGPGVACDISLNTVLTPEERGLYQDPDIIQAILSQTKTVAIVGLSSDNQKASYFVASYLQSHGYRIIPVTPRPGVILGEACRPSLRTIEEKVDLVDVFRPAREVLGIVEESIAIGAKAVWTQLKIVDLEAGEKARSAGLQMVMDKCIKMEHGRYHGSLHWAGMNTEIITAKRKSQI